MIFIRQLNDCKHNILLHFNAFENIQFDDTIMSNSCLMQFACDSKCSTA